MAFDPDEYLAGGTAVAEPPAFDPDQYLAASPPAFDPDAYLDKTEEPARAEPAEIQQADEQAEIERNAGKIAPQWAQNAAGAATEMLSGLVPRSVGQVVELFAPAAIHDVTGTA